MENLGPQHGYLELVVEREQLYQAYWISGGCMIYKEGKDIRMLIESHKNKPIWACAYELQNDKNKNGLIQKPVQGEIYKDGYRTYFAPYKKGSKSLAKSKEVLAEYSRCYADTYEECVELYNSLINKNIMYFWQRMRECAKDRIGDIDVICNNPEDQQLFDIFINYDPEVSNELNQDYR